MRSLLTCSAALLLALASGCQSHQPLEPRAYADAVWTAMDRDDDPARLEDLIARAAADQEADRLLSPQMGVVTAVVAMSERQKGNFALAERYHMAALRSASRAGLLEENAWMTLGLLQLYAEWGRFREADHLFQVVHLGPDTNPPDTPWTLLELLDAEAWLHAAQGRYREAAVACAYARARRDGRTTLEGQPVSLSCATSLLLAQEEYQEALRRTDEAIAAYETAPADWRGVLGRQYLLRAHILERLERFEAAEASLAQSRALLQSIFGPRHPVHALSRDVAGTLYLRRGELERAEAELEGALRDAEEVLGDNALLIAFIARDLGRVYHAQGRLDAASTLYERALSIRAERDEPDVFELAELLDAYAAVLDEIDDRARAGELRTRAEAIRARIATDLRATHLDS